MGQAPLNRVSRPADESPRATRAGNVHPLAREVFDEGPVSGETRLDRMVMLLEPTAAQQAELDALVEAQHDPASLLFHRWLTPNEYAARFGLNPNDLARVIAWLQGCGFTVEEIPAGNRLIVFSGTAGQVTEAFHTSMHRYRVDGAEHIANALEPQIPSPLAGVVGGVVSLHDFRRRSQIGSRVEAGAQPQYSAGSTHYLFPADFAAIYDLNPLYSAGTAGAGSSIAIAGRSNIRLSDVAAFRATSGLAANDPTVILAGADPGLIAGDQDEATLDVEWAGATAPESAVMLVAGDSTATTDGVDLAAAYIVNHAAAPVASVSYGSCEQEMGRSELAFYNELWEQAASQGMSVFVASGDAGAAGCNLGSDDTGSGAAVNGLCSSPYSTCVGGTEFNEGPNSAEYWSATNAASYGSALGYIPEEAWNESALNGGTGLWATGGGASAVYAQPAWQTGVSGTSGGMREVPDVALSAAGHDGYMIYENGSYWIVSGTSAAAPSFAGVMALVAQSQGKSWQGNANAGLYPLSNAAHNPFHATPSGNNSVPGVAGFAAGGAAYNPATGLGSVDGALLVSAWGGVADPSLMLTAGASSIAIEQGSSGTMHLTATTGGSFSGEIGLTVSGLPAGVTAQWSVNPIAPTASVSANKIQLTLSASDEAATGPARIVVTAAGDGLQSIQDATVLVQMRQVCHGRSLPLPGRCAPPTGTPLL